MNHYYIFLMYQRFKKACLWYRIASKLRRKHLLFINQFKCKNNFELSFHIPFSFNKSWMHIDRRMYQHITSNFVLPIPSIFYLPTKSNMIDQVDILPATGHLYNSFRITIHARHNTHRPRSAIEIWLAILFVNP